LDLSDSVNMIVCAVQINNNYQYLVMIILVVLLTLLVIENFWLLKLYQKYATDAVFFSVLTSH